MKFHDITIGISESMPIYEGDPTVSIRAAHSIANGDAANVSQIAFGVHSGTHVDAPNHFIEGGRRVHQLDLEKLVGGCRVIGVQGDITAIEPEHVGNIEGVTRVLFKSRNSEFWSEPERGFRKDFTYITPSTAGMLAEKGVVLVGIDYLSIEASDAPGHPVHVTLLENEIVILEGVDLRKVEPGDYELICLPLKYDGGKGDGAPARTFLRKI